MADPCLDIDFNLLSLGVRLGVYLQLTAAAILIGTGAHATLPGHGQAASATLAAILAVLLVRLEHADILAAEFLLVLFLAGLLAVVATLGVISADPFNTGMIGSLRLCLCVPPPYACASLREASWQRRGRNTIADFDPANRWHAFEAMRLDVAARRRGRRECGITLQVAVLAANAAINVWFWQSGYDGLLDCGQVWAAFCYVKVPAFGWMRYAMLVLSYALLAMLGLVLLLRVCTGMLSCQGPTPSLLARTAAERSVGVDVKRVKVEAECDKRLSTRGTKLAMAWFTVALICWVCGGNLSFIEMGMHYNGFKSADVNLAGLGHTVQMLSILVGATLVLSSFSAPVAPCPMWEAIMSPTTEDGCAGVSRERWVEAALVAKQALDEEHERMQTAPGTAAAGRLGRLAGQTLRRGSAHEAV